jgi:hypothetical protein
MKASMSTQRSVLGFLLAFVLLIVGCTSTQPDKFASTVHGWVPLGTTEKKAAKIMTRKGFECRHLSKENPFNPLSADCLRCDREQYLQHDWSVQFLLQDGKVIGYGPISVDDVEDRAP